jgi:hypothetical protein
MEKNYFMGVENPEQVPDLGGVRASKRLLSIRVLKQHPSIVPFRVNSWKLSRAERSYYHSGYSGVDARSLLAIAVQTEMKNRSDYFEWENITFELAAATKKLITSKNWFGKFMLRSTNIKRII